MPQAKSEVPKVTPEHPGHDHSSCPPERRDKTLDKTLEDTFPTSDPLSTIPDPCAEDPEGDQEER